VETATFLDYLTKQPSYRGQLVHIERIPGRDARYGHLDRPLPEPLAASLAAQGIKQLYTHQAEAINQVRRGVDIIVATSTASGKTLCYNLPVLESILARRARRALYLFPTKALAQDQMRSLRQLSEGYLPFLKFDTFDGDTPQARRAAIKRSCHIVLTNPDMLSLGILPNHSSWARFLANLGYIVIDEAHVYRGVFGSHVANVLRRLQRLCAFYGSHPQIILASATIANPQELASRLTGREIVAINDDGSPHGPRDFAFWNPPLIDSGSGARRSANTEATHLFVELVRHGIRTLAFTRTRRVAELLLVYARDALAKHAPELTSRIKAYRAGYRPEDRRQIERELFHGHLLGVTATTALELGVDIGSLDATILTGYPGTIASTWQQAGRAGRGLGHSLSILIGLDSPLDQYIMHHPDAFFKKPIEHALINPDNPHILSQHLLCAAYELPLSAEDTRLFGGEDTCAPLIGELEKAGYLRYRDDRWYYTGGDYPAQDINIRSTSAAQITIIDRTQRSWPQAVLETVDVAVAFFQVYPGAIYLHQGETYLITDLDLENHLAYAKPTDATYYTQAKDITDVRIIRSLRSRPCRSTTAHWGRVRVTTQVLSFKRKRQFTDEVLSEEMLDLPPVSYETTALWFDIPPDFAERLRAQGLDIAGSLHAIEHAAIGLLPLYAMCDRNDIGGLSTVVHPDTGTTSIFIYDGHPGGVGISEKGFEILPDLWRATLQVVEDCPCEEGCPSCIQSPKCGNNNIPLDKKAAIRLLQGLLSGHGRSGGGEERAPA